MEECEYFPFISAPSEKLSSRCADTSRIRFSRIQPRTDTWNLPLFKVLGCIKAQKSALIVAGVAELRLLWSFL
jgi:hypothetical protein